MKIPNFCSGALYYSSFIAVVYQQRSFGSYAITNEGGVVKCLAMGGPCLCN